jgi:hypothetical protein
MRICISKESGMPSAKVPGGEHALYTIWNAERWREEHTVRACADACIYLTGMTHAYVGDECVVRGPRREERAGFRDRAKTRFGGATAVMNLRDGISW